MNKTQFLFSGTVGPNWDMEVAMGVCRKLTNQFQDKEIHAIMQVNIDSSGVHDIVNHFRSVYYVADAENQHFTCNISFEPSGVCPYSYFTDDKREA